MEDPISVALDIGDKLIGRLWPDPAQAAQAKLELVKLQQSGELAAITATNEVDKAQLAVDQAEAGSTSLFVAGWRPFIGWICGTALGVQFVVAPLATWSAALAGYKIAISPLDMGTLVTLLTGMLGMGAMRTVEKLNGAGRGLL